MSVSVSFILILSASLPKTTLGSGGWLEGLLTAASSSSASVKGPWISAARDVNPIGALFVILAGPGAGQTRRVVSFNGFPSGNITTFQLDAPLDDHVVPGVSVVAVTARTGQRAIVGNTFLWAEVVQFYGVNYGGVIADNNLTHCNVGSLAQGSPSIVGRGECYHGPSPLYFTELTGNMLTNSNGVELNDGGMSAEPECAAYPGPWLRWGVARNNAVGGLAEAGRGASCGNVTVTRPARDVVVEHNVFDCPSGKPGGVQQADCASCVVR